MQTRVFPLVLAEKRANQGGWRAVDGLSVACDAGKPLGDAWRLAPVSTGNAKSNPFRQLSVNTIILTDTFNGRKISSHRTVEAALKAQDKHIRAVRKSNSASSYLTYSVTSSDGRDITSEIEAIRSSE